MAPAFGWVPDLPDWRDHELALAAVSVPLPESVDLRAGCPPVYDQGQLGSCTANAIAAAVEFDLRKQGLTDFVPSRLFVYYNERAIEHTIGTDSGAMIRDGIKAVAKLGDCPETEWPYDIAKFAVPPPAACYSDAKKYRAVSYARANRGLHALKAALSTGFPIVFGFTVYQSFMGPEVARTGVVPMPGPDEAIEGGHAVLLVGYDDADQSWIVRNSWGVGWGQAGYCRMPYEYLSSTRRMASDFWQIRALL